MGDKVSCERCMKLAVCRMTGFASATLPFVKATLAESGLSEWDRKHAIARVLRGNGGSGSPGFTEEAILENLMTRKEVGALSGKILKMKPESVSLATLCMFCHEYQPLSEKH